MKELAKNFCAVLVADFDNATIPGDKIIVYSHQQIVGVVRRVMNAGNLRYD
jgi:hypothetical protein